MLNISFSFPGLCTAPALFFFFFLLYFYLLFFFFFVLVGAKAETKAKSKQAPASINNCASWIFRHWRTQTHNRLFSFTHRNYIWKIEEKSNKSIWHSYNRYGIYITIPLRYWRVQLNILVLYISCISDFSHEFNWILNDLNQTFRENSANFFVKFCFFWSNLS